MKKNPIGLPKEYHMGYADGKQNVINETYETHPDITIRTDYMEGYIDGLGSFYLKEMRDRKKKKNSTVRINPIGTAEELIARAHKEGLVDGKNHASKDSYYTKEAPRELKLSYLDGYSKGKRENPKPKIAKILSSRPKFVVDGDFHTKKAYLSGYDYGFTLIRKDHYEHDKSWDEKAFKEGFSDGSVDRMAQENPKAKRKNSTVRINPMSKENRDAYNRGLKDGSSNYHNASKDEPGNLSYYYALGYKDGKWELLNNQTETMTSYLKRKNSTVRINPPRTMPAHIKHIDSIKAYTHGYNNGYTGKPHKNDQIAHAGDPEAFTEGYEHGILDKRIKTNPLLKRKNSTVRINPKSKYHPAKDPKPGVEPWSFKHGYDDGFKEGMHPSGSFYEPTMEDDITIEYHDGWYEGHRDGEEDGKILRGGPDVRTSLRRTLRKHNPLLKRKNTHLQFEENPKSKKQHPFRRFFPKIKPGRPAGGPKGGYWWILDIFDAKDRKLGHLIGKGTKEKATLDAKYKVGDKYRGKAIERAMLSGPYDRKPTAKTKRK